MPRPPRPAASPAGLREHLEIGRSAIATDRLEGTPARLMRRVGISVSETWPAPPTAGERYGGKESPARLGSPRAAAADPHPGFDDGPRSQGQTVPWW
jgi:hypothetical protein